MAIVAQIVHPSSSQVGLWSVYSTQVGAGGTGAVIGHIAIIGVADGAIADSMQHGLTVLGRSGISVQMPAKSKSMLPSFAPMRVREGVVFTQIGRRFGRIRVVRSVVLLHGLGGELHRRLEEDVESLRVTLG
jgi:hypothetical protein